MGDQGLIWCAMAGYSGRGPHLQAEILVLRHQLNVLRRKMTVGKLAERPS
jgi:hypothetical protein